MTVRIIRDIDDAKRIAGGLVRSLGELQLAWATAGRLGDTRSPFGHAAEPSRVSAPHVLRAQPMDVRFGF